MLGFDIAPTKESNHPTRQNDFLNDDLLALLGTRELVNYSLLKRSSFQTNLSGQLFFFDASLSTAG